MPSEIYSDLAELFADKVLVSGFVSADELGERSYSAGVNVPCRITGSHRIVLDREGQQRLSTMQMICKGAYSLTPDDLYTLPARFDPRYPQCISVQRHTDENGEHHETVFFV